MWFHIDFSYHLALSLSLSLSLSLFRGVFQAGLEVGGCEGALAAMTRICERLSAIREEKRRALKTLQDKKQSIDLFTQIAVSESAFSPIPLPPMCVCVRVLTQTFSVSIGMPLFGDLYQTFALV